MGVDESANGPLLFSPAYGTPVAPGAQAVAVPLTMVKHDGHFLFQDEYSLKLTGKLSREDFSSIVAELNAVATQHGPNMAAPMNVIAVLPIAGVVTRTIWHKQRENMMAALQAACHAINARNAAAGHAGINLRYSEAPALAGHCGGFRRTEMVAQIDVEVMG